MRGLVTLATAFALPSGFPHRDVIVLTAFIVVLGSLMIQGLTVGLLIKLLRLEPDNSLDVEMSKARAAMVDAALASLRDRTGDAASAVRAEYEAMRAVAKNRANPQADTEHDRLRIDAICAQREFLAEIAPGRKDFGRRVPPAGRRARLGRAARVAARRSGDAGCVERPGEARPRPVVSSGRLILRTGRRDHLHRFDAELLLRSRRRRQAPRIRAPGFAGAIDPSDFDLVIGMRLQVDATKRVEIERHLRRSRRADRAGRCSRLRGRFGVLENPRTRGRSWLHAAGVGHLARGRRR